MIGKIIANISGITDKPVKKKSENFKLINKIENGNNTDEWKNFKQVIKSAHGDADKIKTAIKNSKLKDLTNLDGLFDYAVKQSKSRKDVNVNKVNSLIQSQNTATIDNTAKQATGYKGVKNAINLYNQSLTKNKNGITKASDSTKNLISALSETNPQLSKCMEQAQGGSISMKNYAASLVTATAKTAAFNAVTSIMNAGISFAVSYAVSSIITAFDKLAHLEEETAEKAKQLGAEFKGTQSDINGYKEKISSLHATINDSTSSIEDVANARRSLLSIQEEMIQKFGTEKDVIDSVTAAINGQADSLDNLTQAEWLKTKKEFNSYNLSPGDAGKYGLLGSLYLKKRAAGNSERMLEKYGEQTVTFDWKKYAGGQELTEEMIAELENAGITIAEKQEKQTEKVIKAAVRAKTGADGGIAAGASAQALDSLTANSETRVLSITGNAEEVYNKLQSMQAVLGESKGLENLSAQVKTQSEKYGQLVAQYKDYYNQYILQEKILSSNSSYADAYRDINDAYEEYEEARISGDETQLKEAAETYAGIVTGAADNAIKNGDSDVAAYFKNMYPALQAIVKGWKFTLAFDSDTDGLQDKVQSILNKAKDKSGRQLSAEEILGAGSSDKTYQEFSHIAKQYDLSIEELMDVIKERGMVSSIDYQGLVNLFGEENAKKLSDEDLEIAYRLKNIGSMTFDDLQKEIKKSKEQAAAPIADIFTMTSQAGTATNLAILKNNLDAVTSSFKTLKSAVEEFRTTGGLSIETIESLMEQGDNWLDYLETENGQLKVNEEAFYAAAEAKMYELKVQALQNLSDNVLNIRSVDSANEYLQSTLYDTADSYDVLTESIRQNTIAQLENKITNAKTQEEKDSYQQVLDKYKRESQKLDTVFDSSDLTGSINGSSGGLAMVMSKARSASELTNAVEKELSQTGKLSYEQIQQILSAYPVLEGLLMNYLSGKASEQDVMSALKNLYQSDMEDYSNYYRQKMLLDNNFYANTINNLSNNAKNLAAYYNMDLQNYGSYAQAKSGLTAKLNKANSMISLFTPLANISGLPFHADNSFYKARLEEYKQEAAAIETVLNEINAQTDVSFNTTLPLPDSNPVSNPVSNPPSTPDKDNSEEHSIPETEQTFDWIETAIDRLSTALDRLKSKASDTYASWAARSANLQSAIASTRQSIDLQAQAYQRYLAQAESVPLSDAWKHVVQDGAVDISFITDENLSSNIQEYQDWYNKAQDCLKTQLELQDSLNELESQKFTNLQSEYESIIDLMETQKSLIENQITVLSNGADYDQLRSRQESIINTLRGERNALEAMQNSLSIERGTEEWNNLQSTVSKISLSIQDAESSLREINRMQFDNLKEFYDLSTGILEKQRDLAESRITLLSGSGEYEALRQQYRGIISSHEEKQKKLNELMNSNVFAGMSYTDQMDVRTESIESEKTLSEAYAALKGISQLEFDNLMEAAEFDLSRSEHKGTLIDDQIRISEIKSLSADKGLYLEQQKQLNHQQNTIHKEIGQLISIRDASGYEIGTAEWNSMTSEIMALREQESSLTVKIEDINKTIRDINWQAFDYLAGSMDSLLNESDFLSDLMGFEKLIDNNGKFTDEGNASLALDLVNADWNKQKAESYFAEAEKVKKELGRNSGQEMQDRYNELIQKGQESLLAYKSSIKDAISLVEERYNAELDALQKVIDKKKEQLQEEKNLYDYQKSIREKTDHIASLEKQKTAYADDNSEETMARIQRIQLELNEAKEDLAETEYEQYLKDSQDMLDTLAQDYEEWMNIRLDNEEALLTELAGNVNTTGSEIRETLLNIAAENGIQLSDHMTTLFNEIRVLSDRIGTDTEEPGSADVTLEDAQTVLKKALRILPNEEGYTLEDAQKTLRAALKIEDGSSHTQHTVSGTEQAAVDKWQEYMDINGMLPDNIDLGKAQTILKKTLDILPNDKDYNKNDPLKALKIALRITKGYETTPPGISKPIQAQVQTYNSSAAAAAPGQANTGQNRISQSTGQPNRPATDVFLPPSERGGILLTAQNQEHLFDSVSHTATFTPTSHAVPAASTASAARTTPSVAIAPSSFASYAGIRDLYIELPDVKDYNDFRSRLIKDRTFEKAMCTMINNAIMGKSTIDKLKYV